MQAPRPRTRGPGGGTAGRRRPVACQAPTRHRQHCASVAGEPQHTAVRKQTRLVLTSARVASFSASAAEPARLRRIFAVRTHVHESGGGSGGRVPWQVLFPPRARLVFPRRAALGPRGRHAAWQGGPGERRRAAAARQWAGTPEPLRSGCHSGWQRALWLPAARLRHTWQCVRLVQQHLRVEKGARPVGRPPFPTGAFAAADSTGLAHWHARPGHCAAHGLADWRSACFPGRQSPSSLLSARHPVRRSTHSSLPRAWGGCCWATTAATLPWRCRCEASLA